MNDDDKKFVVGAIQAANNDLVDKINNNIVAKVNEVVAKQNKNINYIARRFDEVDKRLNKIEGRLHIVTNETSLLPGIFEILEDDGRDIAKLEKRIDSLEK